MDKKEFIDFIKAFKNDKKIKIEIMAVYLSNNTFEEILNSISSNINFITIYFGDDLLKNKSILENGGFIKENFTDFNYHFLTSETLISEFHLIKDNYI